MPIDHTRPPRPTSHENPRRRSVIPVAGRILAIGFVGVAVLIATGQISGGTDAGSVDLPAAANGESADALHNYLQGTGQPLVRFARALPVDFGADIVDRCAGLTTRLQAAGSPQNLDRIVDGIPDPAVRDAAGGTLTATVRFAGGCLAGTPDDDTRHAAEFQSVVLRRLLAQNGVIL